LNAAGAVDAFAGTVIGSVLTIALWRGSNVAKDSVLNRET